MFVKQSQINLYFYVILSDKTFESTTLLTYISIIRDLFWVPFLIMLQKKKRKKKTTNKFHYY